MSILKDQMTVELVQILEHSKDEDTYFTEEELAELLVEGLGIETARSVANLISNKHHV